jgi:transposase-like protein
MALEIKGTLEFNSTNSELVYTDITGEDNIALSTKYSTGSTNVNRSKANTFTEFVLTNPDFLDSGVLLTTGNVVPADTFTNSLLPPNFNYNDGFEVGVYKVKCYVWYEIDFLEGLGNLVTSTQISGSFDTANFDSIRNGFADTSIVKIVQGSKSAIRTVTSTAGTTATFSEALVGFTTGTENISVYAGYEVTLRALSDDKFLKCFQPKIAKTSIQPTDCCARCKSSDVDNLSAMFFGVFSVYAQFESELYDDANANIKTLLKICQADGCKC